MQTKLIYVAKDGKEFSDETDCFTHETELLWTEIKDEITFFNRNGKFEDDIVTMLEECTAFYCKSVTAAEKLDELFEYVINWSPLSEFGDYEEGLYLYSSYRNCWIHYETEVHYLNDEANDYLNKIAEGEN